jgi:serine/threonine protein kinase
MAPAAAAAADGTVVTIDDTAAGGLGDVSTAAARLMVRYPFAIVMRRAELNLLEAIQNERLSTEPYSELRRVALQLVQSMARVHAAGMAHGDIKPRNVVRAGARYGFVDFDMAFTLDRVDAVTTVTDSRAGPPTRDAGSSTSTRTNTCTSTSTSGSGCGTAAASASAAPDALAQAVVVGSVGGPVADVDKLWKSSAYCCPEVWRAAEATVRPSCNRSPSRRRARSGSGAAAAAAAAAATTTRAAGVALAGCGLSSLAQIDLWALGTTIFELFAGRPLIPSVYDQVDEKGADELRGWAGLSAENRRALRALRGGGGAGAAAQTTNHVALLDLLDWCLDADAGSRPKRASEVLEHAFFHPHGALREHIAVAEIKRLLAAPTSGGRPRVRKRVMISYNWGSSPFVLRLCRDLADKVEGLLLDRFGGARGMGEWVEASMDSMVQQADVVVACVSKGYVASKNCGIEMRLAADTGTPVIPINLELSHQDWVGGSLATIGPVGDAIAMTSQFQSPTGDTKLYVDFTDVSKYHTKLHQELLPRIAAATASAITAGTDGGGGTCGNGGAQTAWHEFGLAAFKARIAELEAENRRLWVECAKARAQTEAQP